MAFKRSTIVLLVLFFIFGRNKLIAFVRLVRQLYRGNKLLKALPGPGKEFERGLLGHMAGPLILEPGHTFVPEYFVENLVKKLIPISQTYKNDGLFRMFALNSSIPCNVLGVIIPNDITIVREILSHKSMQDFNKGFAYKVAHQLIGDSILSTSREAWAPQRPIVERGFAHDIVGKSVPKILQTANELADKWERKARASGNEAVQDVREDMLRLTMDVIGRAAFGFDFNSTTSDVAPLYEPFMTILYGLERRSNYIHEHFMRHLWFLEQNKKLDKAFAKLDGLVDEIQRNRRAELPEDKAKRQVDFLDMLLKNNEMSEQLVKDNIKTLLFAGHDTTGAALAWFFYLLAKHPEVQRRVRAEVLQKFGKHGDPSYEDLEQMHLMNACFLETLRLYPSAGFMRRPRHDVQIGEYTVPAHCEILFLPYLLQRDERYWEKPNDYIPERFLNEGYDSAQGTNSRMDSLQSRIARIAKDKAYFPFSLGPRNCVGRPLALAEMRGVAIKLLQRFTFRLSDDPEFDEVPHLTMTLNPKSIRLVPVLKEGEM